MTGELLQTGRLIALDWGTTNVRAALLDATGMVLDQRNGESGVGRYSKAEFAERFENLTEGWPNVPAIAAGMVGSRQGWKEAGYLPCPSTTSDLGQNLTAVDFDGRTISIVPGLQINRHDHLDCLLYTSPSPRDKRQSRMPSSA